MSGEGMKPLVVVPHLNQGRLKTQWRPHETWRRLIRSRRRCVPGRRKLYANGLGLGGSVKQRRS